MSRVSASCPPAVTLVKYINGLLEFETEVEVGKHIEACPSCRRIVANETQRANAEGFGASLADSLEPLGGGEDIQTGVYKQRKGPPPPPGAKKTRSGPPPPPPARATPPPPPSRSPARPAPRSASSPPSPAAQPSSPPSLPQKASVAPPPRPLPDPSPTPSASREPAAPSATVDDDDSIDLRVVTGPRWPKVVAGIGLALAVPVALVAVGVIPNPVALLAGPQSDDVVAASMVDRDEGDEGDEGHAEAGADGTPSEAKADDAPDDAASNDEPVHDGSSPDDASPQGEPTADGSSPDAASPNGQPTHDGSSPDDASPDGEPTADGSSPDAASPDGQPTNAESRVNADGETPSSAKRVRSPGDVPQPSIRIPPLGAANPDLARRLAQDAASAARRDPARAEQLYRSALEHDELNLQALSGLSELLSAKEHHGAALAYAARAVDVAPGQAQLRLRLGDAYVNTRALADARIQYLKARSLGHRRAYDRLEALENALAGSDEPPPSEPSP